jgi:hypothetical protein
MRLPESLDASLQLKLLSLFFAAVLWLFVRLETGTATDMPLAVDFVNIPAGVSLQVTPSTPLSLSVTGPRTLLLRQKWLGARLRLDLAGTRPGHVVFSELDRYVQLVPGVRPLKVSPEKIEIFLTGN